jgi:hypothetical protein
MSDLKPWSVVVTRTRLQCTVELTEAELQVLDGLDFVEVVQPRLVAAGALQNSVEYNSHFGAAVYFAVNGAADADGVLSSVKELVREHGLVREEAGAPALPASGRQETLVVLMVFTDPVHERVKAVAETAGHVPKFWDVSDEERALVGRLFEAPECGPGGRTLRFSLSVGGSDEQLERLRELAAEMAKKVDGKRLMVGDGDFPSCQAAVGGFLADVRLAAERLCADGPEQERRIAALEGLLHAGGKAQSLFADWALQELVQTGDPDDVDWRSVESKFLLLCQGCGVSKADAVKTLCEHSPGATSALRQQSIRDEATQLFEVADRSASEHRFAM